VVHLWKQSISLDQCHPIGKGLRRELVHLSEARVALRHCQPRPAQARCACRYADLLYKPRVAR